jgi:flagellar hook-associated protein 3 FlgL
MSFNRVSTANSYDTTIARISQRQADIASGQEKLAAGKRVLKASDDPTAAALAERERARMQRVQVDQRSIDASRRTMELAENTLGSVTELYQRAKELIVQAGNGTLSSSDRQSVAQELDGIRDSVLRLANAKDVQGRPLFMGLGLASEPGEPNRPFFETPPDGALAGDPLYDASGRTVAWRGVTGQPAPTDNTLPTSLDGSAIFGVPAASGQTEENIWDTLDRVIFSLRSDPATDPALNADFSANLALANAGINKRLDDVMLARGALGDWLNRADAMTAQLQEREAYHQIKESELTDLDMVKAISQFQTQQLGLQAALQSYGQVQRLSLFQYIA